MATELKIAHARGYHEGVLREPGDEFYADEGFTGKWFTTAGSVEAKAKTKAEDPIAELLKGKVGDILNAVPKLSDADLRKAIDVETGGNARKSLLARLTDEVANRVGNLPEPAKDEDKKDEGEKDNPFA
jgi:hypothetical protein